MKLIAVIISAMLATYSVAVAQGNPSGRGSTTGDPAASTANPPRRAWRNGRRQFGRSEREWHVNLRRERRQWRSRPRQDAQKQHECAIAGSAAREAEVKVPRLMTKDLTGKRFGPPLIARVSSSGIKGEPKWPGKHRKSSKCRSEWKSTCICARSASKRRATREAEQPLRSKLRSPVSNGGAFLLPLLTSRPALGNAAG